MFIAIFSGLLLFVVPKVFAVFESNRAKLPLITRLLIGTSDFFRAYGLWLLIAAVISAVLFTRWLRNPLARRQFQRLQLRMPIIGKLTRGSHTARFTRKLRLLPATS